MVVKFSDYQCIAMWTHLLGSKKRSTDLLQSPIWNLNAPAEEAVGQAMNLASTWYHQHIHGTTIDNR